MAYADLIQSAISDEFSERAVSITYNGVTVSAVFRFVGVDGAGSRSSADQGTLLLLKSSVPTPANGDIAVVSGQTWRVIKMIRGGGPHTTKLLVERNRGRIG